MKRKITLVSVILLCLTIIGSGSLAYFTAEDYAHNIITSNGIDIQIIEQMLDENGDLVDFPEEGVHVGMPGTSVSKIVTVMNMGDEPAWIRVKIDETAVAQDGTALSNVVGDDLIMQYTVDAESWIANRGWYYYSQPLAPGEATTELFSQVHFAQWMGNEYENSTMNLIVYAQAVQTANNGDTVQDAQGWPDKLKAE